MPSFTWANRYAASPSSDIHTVGLAWYPWNVLCGQVNCNSAEEEGHTLDEASVVDAYIWSEFRKHTLEVAFWSEEPVFCVAFWSERPKNLGVAFWPKASQWQRAGAEVLYYTCPHQLGWWRRWSRAAARSCCRFRQIFLPCGISFAASFHRESGAGDSARTTAPLCKSYRSRDEWDAPTWRGDGALFSALFNCSPVKIIKPATVRGMDSNSQPDVRFVHVTELFAFPATLQPPPKRSHDHKWNIWWATWVTTISIFFLLESRFELNPALLGLFGSFWTLFFPLNIMMCSSSFARSRKINVNWNYLPGVYLAKCLIGWDI